MVIQEPEIKFLHQHLGETSQERTVLTTILVHKNIKSGQNSLPSGHVHSHVERKTQSTKNVSLKAKIRRERRKNVSEGEGKWGQATGRSGGRGNCGLDAIYENRINKIKIKTKQKAKINHPRRNSKKARYTQAWADLP